FHRFRLPDVHSLEFSGSQNLRSFERFGLRNAACRSRLAGLIRGIHFPWGIDSDRRVSIEYVAGSCHESTVALPTTSNQSANADSIECVGDVFRPAILF